MSLPKCSRDSIEMAATSLVFLLFAAAACSAFPQPDRIVGGQPTTIQNYPSIVQVDYLSGTSWSHSCAGSILTPNVVVSAAHCFSGWSFSVAARRIRAGTTDRNSGGVTVQLSSVLNHPGYGTFSYDNDISILKLASSLTFSNSIQSISILAQDVELPDNLPVIHAGWGYTTQNGSPSPVLLDVTVLTINRQVCAQRYSNIWASVTNNMICAGILDVGGKDACDGDSGGPLYYDNILVGVVSWGAGCAQAYYPGVSARVSSYTNWIIANSN